MIEDPVSHLPLSAANLHILLALAGEERHGYGIMQEVVRQSGGRYKLGPGTLYDNLRKLLDNGVVEETGALSPDDDPRRRYYKLSEFGKTVLQSEVSRLDAIIRQARAHLRPAAGRPS